MSRTFVRSLVITPILQTKRKKTILSQILINRENENFNIKFTESIKENRKEKNYINFPKNIGGAVFAQFNTGSVIYEAYVYSMYVM